MRNEGPLIGGVKLVRGWFTSNPSEAVIFKCPRCKKHGKPRLVSVHHARPELRLYGCEGCKQYLIQIGLSECCEHHRSDVLRAHAHEGSIADGFTVRGSLAPRR